MAVDTGLRRSDELTSPNGSSTIEVSGPRNSGRKVRVPELALGLLLMAGCGIGALWLLERSAPEHSVLITASEIRRGQLIEASDLAVLEIQASGDLEAISAQEISTVPGAIAQVDLGPGVILNYSLLGSGSDISKDDALIGLYLGADRLPSLGLHAGAKVDIVKIGSGGSGAVLATGAPVVNVTAGSGFGQLHVSLEVKRNVAIAVAEAAANDNITLVQVAED